MWKYICAGVKDMFKNTKKKAKDLAKELIREIKISERELQHKKQLLASLDQFQTEPGLRHRGPFATKRPTMMVGAKRGRKPKPVRRKSKNRDIILNAANKLKGKFSLADLVKEIRKKNTKFGGKYPSGTILAVLRTTPEIKKQARGIYFLRK